MTLPFSIFIKCNAVIASEALRSDERFLVGVGVWIFYKKFELKLYYLNHTIYV